MHNFLGESGLHYYITLQEFLSNGFVMSVIVLVGGIAQATLSQASTHILNVEGIRLKTALQVSYIMYY